MRIVIKYSQVVALICIRNLYFMKNALLNILTLCLTVALAA